MSLFNKAEPLAKDYPSAEAFTAAHDKWAADRHNTPDHSRDRPDAIRGDFDFGRIKLLLDVIASAVAHGPAFTNLITEANLELSDLNTRALAVSTSRVKAKAEADAKLLADEQSRKEKIAAQLEQKLKADAQANADAGIKAKAMADADAIAKAETAAKVKADADRAAGRPIDPPVDEKSSIDASRSTPPPFRSPSPGVPQSEYVNEAQPAYVSPEPDSTFTTSNGRRI